MTITEDDDILQHNKLALLEILVKHIYDRDFNEVIDYIVQAFKVAQAQHINHALINGAMYYLLSGRERNELDPLIEQLKQNIPEYGETLMTYAEELRQEGIQKGMQLGEIKTREEIAKIAKELLKSGIDSSVIAAATHLTVDQIKSLK